jgi:hypothetical protein
LNDASNSHIQLKSALEFQSIARLNNCSIIIVGWISHENGTQFPLPIS